jgi:hypothetical protein
MRFERVHDGLEDAAGEFSRSVLQIAFELSEGRRGEGAAMELLREFSKTHAPIEDLVE